jgi:hypothetical protein
MGMFGGGKQKRIPNSQKKKGGLAKDNNSSSSIKKETVTPIPIVPEKSKGIKTDNPEPSKSPIAISTISVSERAKSFNNTANDKPTVTLNAAKDKPTEAPITKTNEEPKKATPKFGLFGKGKSKATDTKRAKESSKEVVKPIESPATRKTKFGLFGKSKNKATDTNVPSPSDQDTAKESGSTSNNNAVPTKPGKLSIAALNLNIPGLGGGPRGTNQEKSGPGKPPPQIDIYTESEQNPDSQGHATMSERAKQTLVAPKETNLSKGDWKFLYELATQYDSYKLQQAEASKTPAASKQKAPPVPVSGDTEAIKNNLNSLFGGGDSGVNYTSNGSFLNNKYFDQYLVGHSSGVALEFSNETSLYKFFCRKDQEQRTISEKFVAALLKHPKAKKITQLNMSSALLPDAFLVALCDQCGSGSGLPLLQVLNLESNDLGREGIEALSKCIASPKAFNRLQILKLENQKKEISAGAEEVLGEAIVQSQSLVQVGLRMKGGIPKQQVSNTVQANLDKLRLARRQHASKKGTLKARKRNEMETLFDTIAANKDKNITEVDLTDNLRFLGLNETERTKTGAAFATNKTVTKVTMTKLKLDDDFAEAFGKALMKNKTLETVVLDSNSFSAKGVKALLTGLGQNKSITNFQIRHQSKTMASSDEEALLELLNNNTILVNIGSDVRNPLIKSQLDRKTNENREFQRKQRVALKKK